MRLIVAGSRDIDSSIFDRFALDELVISHISSPITELLCGMAKGADMVGYEWAKAHGVPIREYPARWDKHGKAAGVIRNQQMAADADILVALWDGKSNGTRHMIDMMSKARKPFHVELLME